MDNRHVGQSYQGGRFKNNKTTFLNLAMTHEEKALKNEYGNHVDSQVLTMQPKRLTTPMKLRGNFNSKNLKPNGRVVSARNDFKGQGRDSGNDLSGHVGLDRFMSN